MTQGLFDEQVQKSIKGRAFGHLPTKLLDLIRNPATRNRPLACLPTLSVASDLRSKYEYIMTRATPRYPRHRFLSEEGPSGRNQAKVILYKHQSLTFLSTPRANRDQERRKHGFLLFLSALTGLGLLRQPLLRWEKQSFVFVVRAKPFAYVF